MSKRNKRKKKNTVWNGILNDIDSDDGDYFICKNCGRRISADDFYNHDGLCKFCRGMMAQKNFPLRPHGFPGF